MNGDPDPRSTMQAVGKVAEDVVSGLKANPVLLGLLLLNAIGIGAATWFLTKLTETSQERWQALFNACLPHIGGGAP